MNHPTVLARTSMCQSNVYPYFEDGSSSQAFDFICDYVILFSEIKLGIDNKTGLGHTVRCSKSSACTCNITEKLPCLFMCLVLS